MREEKVNRELFDGRPVHVEAVIPMGLVEVVGKNFRLAAIKDATETSTIPSTKK